MEKKSKSLSLFIETLVESFNYEDFQPDIDKDNLKRRFMEALSFETAYWKPIDVPPSFRTEWLALDVKQFENSDFYLIMIHVGKNNVKLVVCKDITDGNFQDKCHEENVSIKSIWQDHSLLSSALIRAVTEAINGCESKKA